MRYDIEALEDMDESELSKMIYQDMVRPDPALDGVISFRKYGGNYYHYDNKGFTVIHKLCMGYGNPKHLIFLINDGVDIDVGTSIYGYTPLHVAVFNDRLDIVRILLNAGANVNAKDSYGNTAWE